jgi:hypothetical protein
MELAEGCTVVESAILKGTHEYLPDEKEGTWYVAMKIENDEVWKSVKDGAYTGISLYGFATRTEDEPANGSAAEDTEEKSFFKTMKEFFTKDAVSAEHIQLIKDFNAEVERMDFEKLSNAFWGTVYSIFDDETITDKKAAILESIDQIRTKVESMGTAKSLIAKAGKVLSAENIKKIQAAMDVMQSLMDAATQAEEKRKEFYKSDSRLRGNDNGGQMENTIEKTKYDADIAAKDAEIAKMKTENEELKKKSNGSQQVEGDPPKTEPVKPVYKWLGGPMQVKSEK